jgi:hypothetical protein
MPLARAHHPEKGAARTPRNFVEFPSMAQTPQRPSRKFTPSIGDILDQVVRKEGLGKKELKGRRLARKVLTETLGDDLAAHADVHSVKAGVVTIEADSSALFQELEGFRLKELAEAFRKAGMNIREVRVQLSRMG